MSHGPSEIILSWFAVQKCIIIIIIIISSDVPIIIFMADTNFYK